MKRKKTIRCKNCKQILRGVEYDLNKNSTKPIVCLECENQQLDEVGEYLDSVSEDINNV